MTAHVLGGDLSLTSTGAATITADQRVTTWVKTTDSLPCRNGHKPCKEKEKCGPALIDVHGRIRTIARWFCGLVTTGTVLVVLEGPPHGIKLGQPDERAGLRWIIVNWLMLHEVPVAVLNPTTVKGYATGKGNASKTDVKRAMAAYYPGQGLARVTDDEADAGACAMAGADWVGWPGPFLEGRRGVGWLRNAAWPERESVRA